MLYRIAEMEKLSTRPARIDELDFLQRFLVEHGKNEWNYLPADAVAAQFERLTARVDRAVVAVDQQSDSECIVGLGIYGFTVPVDLLRQSEISVSDSVMYVREMCVSRAHVGRGIGSIILRYIIKTAVDMDIAECIIDRHSDNAASAGMMAKAGFVERAIYADARRAAGSGRTTVMGRQLGEIEG